MTKTSPGSSVMQPDKKLDCFGNIKNHVAGVGIGEPSQR